MKYLGVYLLTAWQTSNTPVLFSLVKKRYIQ